MKNNNDLFRNYRTNRDGSRILSGKIAFWLFVLSILGILLIAHINGGL